MMSCRELGLQSLPVAFGVDVAKWITVGTIDVTQISVAAYLLLGLHQPLYAGILAALVAPQVTRHALLHFCAQISDLRAA